MTPKLRFREFSDEWISSTIGGEGSFYYGKSAPKWSVSEDAKTECVRYGELYSKYSGIVDKIHSRTNIDVKNLKLSKGGEVLVPRVGEDPLDFAKCSYLPFKNVAIGEMISVYNTENDGFFMSSYFRATCKYKFARVVEGGNVSNLYFRYLEPIKIFVPNKAEQIKIGSLISVLDKKINLLTKKKEALITYKKGLMQKIFSQELRFKREDGTDYPEWEESEIGQIFNEVRNKVGDSVVETFSITAGKGFVSQAKKFGRDISGNQNPNYIRLKPNQYSYNKGNSKTFKYGCVYRNMVKKDIAVPNVFISLDLVNGDYKYFDSLFESHYLDRHLRKIISSSARMDGLLNIPKKDFFLISLPAPCLEEQAKIGLALSQSSELIGVIERQLKCVNNFKKGLLQQMFV